MRHAALAALALGLVCGACQSESKKPPAEPATSDEAQPTKEAKSATASADAIADDISSIPTVEDFEEEAARAITSNSDLGKELDFLDHEIDG